MTRIPLRFRIALVLALAALVAVGAYAFTATNTVSTSNAGIGSGAISGYTITNVSYSLNATFDKITDVTFDINPGTTSLLKIKLTDSGSWIDCPNASGGGTQTVTCSLSTPFDLASADNLTVVATS